MSTARKEQRKFLAEWLYTKSKDLAELYEQSIQLLENQEAPARIHLISHCVREIGNRLPEMITGQFIERVNAERQLQILKSLLTQLDNSYKDKEHLSDLQYITVPLSFRSKFQELLLEFEKNRKARKERYTEMISILTKEVHGKDSSIYVAEWKSAIDFFISKVHVSSEFKKQEQSDVHEENLIMHFEKFENGIMEAIKGTALAAHEVENIVAKLNASPSISLEDLRSVLSKLPRMTQRIQFYQGCSNPSILELLFELGEYNRAPEPEVDEQTGNRTCSHWPQGQYLASHGNTNPPIASKIIERLQDSRNREVIETLLQVLLRLPDEQFKKHRRTLTSWLTGPFSHLLQKHLEEVFSRLTHLCPKESFELFEKLLSSTGGDVAYKSDGWEVFEKASLCYLRPWTALPLMKRITPILMVKDPSKTTRILCKKLKKAIDYDRNRTPEYDGSAYWLPELFGSNEREKDALPFLSSLLATAISVTIENTSPVDTCEVLAELKRWHSPIFRRFIFHIYQSSPAYELEAKKALLEYENFDCSDLRKEYIDLLEIHFKDFSHSEKQQFYSMLDNKFPKQSESSRYRDIDDRCLRDWLSLIEEHLSDDRKREFDSLIEEYGQPKRSYQYEAMTSEWLAKEEVSRSNQADSMHAKDILELLLLQDQKAEDEAIMLKSFTIIQLEHTLSNRFVEFIPFLDQVLLLNPSVIMVFLQTASQHVSELKTLEARKLTNFASKCLSELKNPKLEDRVARFQFIKIREQTLELCCQILANLEMSKLEIAECADSIRLALNCPRFLETQPFNTEEVSNPIHITSNSSIAKRIHLLMSCSRRLFRKNPGLEAERLEKILEILQDWWNSNYPLSAVELAAFSSNLGTLLEIDSIWTKSKLDDLFPEGDCSKFNYSWSNFVQSHRPNKGLLDILLRKYEYAIETMKPLNTMGKRDSESETSLGEHILYFSYNEIIELNHPLLQKFLNQAEISVLRANLSQLGSILNSNLELPSSTLSLLQNLWMLVIESRAECNDDRIAIGSVFDLWFASDRFDRDWSLAQLNFCLLYGQDFSFPDEVMKQLMEHFTDEPEKVLEIVHKMIIYPSEPWTIHSLVDSVKGIIKIAFEVPNETLHRLSVKIIDELYRRGINLKFLIPQTLSWLRLFGPKTGTFKFSF